MQQQTTDTLTALAVLTRSSAAQHILARSAGAVRRAVAANPFLDPTLANVLVLDKDVRTAQHASLCADDPAVLAQVAAGGMMRARWALRNPAMPVDVLVDAAHSGVQELAYPAVVNPSTPLTDRKQVITARTAWQLIEVRSSVVAGGLAAELALANRWMAESTQRWTPRVRRGLICIPDATRSALRRSVYQIRTEYRWDRHPSLTGIDVSAMRMDDALDLAHPAIDLALLESGRLGATDAAELCLVRRGASTATHILARAVRAHGPGILAGTAGRLALDASKFDGAAAFTPVITYRALCTAINVTAAVHADAVLGADDTAWEHAVALIGRGFETSRAVEMAGKLAAFR
jgi:hypothetical protein